MKKEKGQNDPKQSDKPEAPLFGLEPGWFNKLLDTASAPQRTYWNLEDHHLRSHLNSN